MLFHGLDSKRICHSFLFQFIHLRHFFPPAQTHKTKQKTGKSINVLISTGKTNYILVCLLLLNLKFRIRSQHILVTGFLEFVTIFILFYFEI